MPQAGAVHLDDGSSLRLRLLAFGVRPQKIDLRAAQRLVLRAPCSAVLSLENELPHHRLRIETLASLVEQEAIERQVFIRQLSPQLHLPVLQSLRQERSAGDLLIVLVVLGPLKPREG